MELTTTTVLIAFAGVFLICFMKGAFGGGFSIVGIPLLSFVMDPVTAGGLLALSSNIGRHSDSRFSTVSEFSTRVAYQLSPQWKGYVGYDVMYWTGVVRPGGAIDTVVNPNLIPPVAPGGPPRPAVQFSSTDFWSQGVSIGLAYNY